MLVKSLCSDITEVSMLQTMQVVTLCYFLLQGFNRMYLVDILWKYHTSFSIAGRDSDIVHISQTVTCWCNLSFHAWGPLSSLLLLLLRRAVLLHWNFFRIVFFEHYTHTHTHLTALFSGIPGSAGTRKVKPIWILLKQETVSGNGISWAICNSAPSCRQITMPAPHHSVFYRPDALPATQPTASKHWRQHLNINEQ